MGILPIASIAAAQGAGHRDCRKKRKREIHAVEAVYAVLGCGERQRGDFRQGYFRNQHGGFKGYGKFHDTGNPSVP